MYHFASSLQKISLRSLLETLGAGRTRKVVRVRHLPLLFLIPLVVTSCGMNGLEASIEKNRRQHLDARLATLSTGLALAREYASYNADEACRYASIPDAAADGFSDDIVDNPSLADSVTQYVDDLKSIYKEEHLLCLAFERVRDETKQISEEVLSTGQIPEQLFLFYASPGGIMSDLRKTEHERAAADHQFSKSYGFGNGEWLGFEIARERELVVGLFRSRGGCDATEKTLADSGIPVRPCRPWQSEQLSRLSWEPA